MTQTTDAASAVDARTSTISYVEAINTALADALESDDRVFLMGEEIGTYGGVYQATKGLRERFGSERVRDTPICEQSLVGTATGAAVVGEKPIVEIMFMDFIAGAMDAITNHAAKLRFMSGDQIRVPLIVRTQGGSGTRHGSQHSQMFDSWFTHIPGLFVVMPSTPADYLGLFRTAMECEDPVIIIEPRLLYRSSGPVLADVTPIPFGSARVVRPGDDVTVVATGLMVQRAEAAADELATEGIDIEVIDPRTLAPFDVETVTNSVRRTGRLVVVHEEVERSGWGGEAIAAVLPHVFDALKAAPRRVATKGMPIPFGPELEEHVVPQTTDIVAAVRNLMEGQR